MCLFAECAVLSSYAILERYFSALEKRRMKETEADSNGGRKERSV